MFVSLNRGEIIMIETETGTEDATDQVKDEGMIDTLLTTIDEGGEIGSTNTFHQQKLVR